MERVAFVSVPENGSAITIEEGKLIARKIIDRKRRLQTINDTSSYVNTENLIEMSDCISDLILEAREKRCESSFVEKHPFVLEVLSEKLAVVINEIRESVKLACGENVFSIEENFALIDYDNCNLMSAEKQIMSGKWESKLSDPLSDAQGLVKIEEFTTDKRIRALRKEIIRDIEEI